MYIKDILVEKGEDIYSVDREHSVRDTVMLMMEYDIGSVLIMDGDKIAGILTKQDILAALGDKGDIVVQLKVSDLMSRNVITCTLEDSTDHALHVMNQNRICHLPVIEDGKVCGLVSMWDLLKAVNDSYQFENKLLKRYIQAWPDERRGTGLKLVVNNKFRHPVENSGMP